MNLSKRSTTNEQLFEGSDGHWYKLVVASHHGSITRREWLVYDHGEAAWLLARNLSQLNEALTQC